MQVHNISIATIADKAAILPLMLRFKEEGYYKNLPTDEEEILKTIDTYINKDKKDTIVLLMSSSERSEEAAIATISTIGIIVGTASKLPFNKQIQAAETIWYVLPEYRHTGIGLELYDAFYYWAENIVKADVIHTASPMGSGLDKVFKKQDYELLEEVYFKVIR